MVDGLTWNIITIIIRNTPHPPCPDAPPWGSTQAQAEDHQLGTGRDVTFMKQRDVFTSTSPILIPLILPVHRISAWKTRINGDGPCSK
jgi:hypothetical protein